MCIRDRFRALLVWWATSALWSAASMPTLVHTATVVAWGNQRSLRWLRMHSPMLIIVFFLMEPRSCPLWVATTFSCTSSPWRSSITVNQRSRCTAWCTPVIAVSRRTWWLPDACLLPWLAITCYAGPVSYTHLHNCLWRFRTIYQPYMLYMLDSPKAFCNSQWQIWTFCNARQFIPCLLYTSRCV